MKKAYTEEQFRKLAPQIGVSPDIYGMDYILFGAVCKVVGIEKHRINQIVVSPDGLNTVLVRASDFGGPETHTSLKKAAANEL